MYCRLRPTIVVPWHIGSFDGSNQGKPEAAVRRSNIGATRRTARLRSRLIVLRAAAAPGATQPVEVQPIPGGPVLLRANMTLRKLVETGGVPPGWR
jgi:hypothetical protein